MKFSDPGQSAGGFIVVERLVEEVKRLNIECNFLLRTPFTAEEIEFLTWKFILKILNGSPDGPD
jgi:hypothetical protein